METKAIWAVQTQIDREVAFWGYLELQSRAKMAQGNKIWTNKPQFDDADLFYWFPDKGHRKTSIFLLEIIATWPNI